MSVRKTILAVASLALGIACGAGSTTDATGSATVGGALCGATDAACAPSTTAEGNSGNVILTSATTSGYMGTFDVILIGGDHITGSFTTATCAPLSNPGPNTSCIP